MANTRQNDQAKKPEDAFPDPSDNLEPALSERMVRVRLLLLVTKSASTLKDYLAELRAITLDGSESADYFDSNNSHVVAESWVDRTKNEQAHVRIKLEAEELDKLSSPERAIRSLIATIQETLDLEFDWIAISGRIYYRFCIHIILKPRNVSFKSLRLEQRRLAKTVSRKLRDYMDQTLDADSGQSYVRKLRALSHENRFTRIDRAIASKSKKTGSINTEDFGTYRSIINDRLGHLATHSLARLESRNIWIVESNLIKPLERLEVAELLSDRTLKITGLRNGGGSPLTLSTMGNNDSAKIEGRVVDLVTYDTLKPRRIALFRDKTGNLLHLDCGRLPLQNIPKNQDAVVRNRIKQPTGLDRTIFTFARNNYGQYSRDQYERYYPQVDRRFLSKLEKRINELEKVDLVTRIDSQTVVVPDTFLERLEGLLGTIAEKFPITFSTSQTTRHG